MPEPSGLAVAVMVLAAFRLTHLIVFDHITHFLRAPFLMEYMERDPQGRLARVAVPRGTGLRRWIGQLLGCPWCLGVWASAAVVAGYWASPTWSMPVLLVLAVSGGAVTLEFVTQWHAKNAFTPSEQQWLAYQQRLVDSAAEAKAPRPTGSEQTKAS